MYYIYEVFLFLYLGSEFLFPLQRSSGGQDSHWCDDNKLVRRRKINRVRIILLSGHNRIKDEAVNRSIVIFLYYCQLLRCPAGRKDEEMTMLRSLQRWSCDTEWLFSASWRWLRWSEFRGVATNQIHQYLTVSIVTAHSQRLTEDGGQDTPLI